MVNFQSFEKMILTIFAGILIDFMEERIFTLSFSLTSPPGISFFFPSLSPRIMVFQSQDTATRCTHCYWSVRASRLRHCTEPGNFQYMHMKCIHTDTSNSNLTHHRVPSSLFPFYISISFL